jgi:hypothetical protein
MATAGAAPALIIKSTRRLAWAKAPAARLVYDGRASVEINCYGAGADFDNIDWRAARAMDDASVPRSILAKV